MEAATPRHVRGEVPGAGQGARTLVAEVLSGQLARALGLPVPELVTVEVDPALAAGEPDEEVQDLPAGQRRPQTSGWTTCPARLDLTRRCSAVGPELAGRVLWFDALVGNVDRSWRNPNLLHWHGRPYLIDHGATLTFQHNWPTADRWVAPAVRRRDHVLIGCAPDVAAADTALAPLVTPDAVGRAVADVPAEWLEGTDRDAYADLLLPGSTPVAVAAGPCSRRPRRGTPLAPPARRNRPRFLGGRGDPARVRVRGAAGRPRVDRGETMNAGVSRSTAGRWTTPRLRVWLDVDRLRALDPGPTRTTVRGRCSPPRHLRRLPRRGAGGPGGPRPAVPLADRAAQHRHPAGARAHRPDHGPGRGRGPAAAPAGAPGPG
jgi:hypothetical protein